MNEKIPFPLEGKVKYCGDLLIRVVRDGTLVKTEIVHNTITNNAFDEIIKPLYGIAADMEIKYLGYGSGTSTPDATQTELDTELGRVADIGLARSDVGQVVSEFLIPSATVATINELAIFAGSTSSGYADTGLMIARVLWAHDKVAGEEIFIQRVDTIA